MANRKVQVVILGEDKQQAAFARRFFTKRGFHPRKIRLSINPQGEGSGEQFVREQYPQEVKTYRNKSSYQSILLVVVIDADKKTVRQRLKQLDLALTDTAQQTRQNSDNIAVFIPKRNIETWIHYLMDKAVDEQTAYPKLAREGDCKIYVDKLVDTICPVGLPANAPPSLHTACTELERIL